MRRKKVRAWRKGGNVLQAGDGDGTAAVTQYKTGDGAGEELHQRASERDGANGATVPLLAAAGAGRRGNVDTVGGRRRGTSESTCGTITPVSMGATEAPREQEGLPENPKGGRVQGTFWD